jgi:hypothetical protein
LGEGSRRGKEGHGERKVKEVRLPASRIALVRPPACGIAPTAAQQPLHTPYHAFIHPRSIADPWTAADPWTEWHGADMAMHMGKRPGDKTKRALGPSKNSQGGTRKTASYRRAISSWERVELGAG